MELRGSHGRSESTSDDPAPVISATDHAPCCHGLFGQFAGPKAVRYTRMRYNEVMRDTNDEQLLMNIVRLHYADSPVFIDLPSITSQFEVSGRGNYLGGTGNQFRGKTNLGFGELLLRDTPTLSYHPREGRDIAKALLTPLSSDLFIVVNAGADIEQLLLLTINDINDVQNAHAATILAPKVPSDNERFRRGIQLLSSLRQHEATELAFGTNEESEISSEPIPKGAVQGRDLLNAARDGYVYRAGRRASHPGQAGEGTVSQNPPRVRRLPRNAGSEKHFSTDPRSEPVQVEVRAGRGGRPEASQSSGK